MSATAQEIINAAFREGNIFGVNEIIPSADVEEALPRLNNIIRAMMGYEIGEEYIDWSFPEARTAPIPARYPIFPRDEEPDPAYIEYPPINARVITKLTTDRTIYLYQRPSPGARMSFQDIGSTPGLSMTIDANGRTIDGMLTQVVDPTTYSGARLFYRDDIAGWITLADLELGDAHPLPPEFDDLWITALAVRLSGRYQSQLSDVTQLTYTQMVSKVKARYRQKTKKIRTDARQINPRHGFRLNNYERFG